MSLHPLLVTAVQGYSYGFLTSTTINELNNLLDKWLTEQTSLVCVCGVDDTAYANSLIMRVYFNERMRVDKDDRYYERRISLFGLGEPEADMSLHSTNRFMQDARLQNRGYDL